MATFKGKFESVRQDWETPAELFDTANAAIACGGK